MTDLATKLIALRDAEPFAIPWDRRIEYVDSIIDACAKVEDGGGGLLERHAMLEELWAAMSGHDEEQGWFISDRTRNAIAALRASDPLPPGAPVPSPRAVLLRGLEELYTEACKAMGEEGFALGPEAFLPRIKALEALKVAAQALVDALHESGNEIRGDHWCSSRLARLEKALKAVGT